MDVISILGAAAAIFAASFFSTISGFGFALIATPFLAMVMPLKTAIVFVLLVTMILRATTMLRTRKEFDWATVLMTTFGCFVGMVPGSLVLKLMPVALLQKLLACVLLAATVLMSLQYTLKISNVTLGRIGAGVLSGFFGSATSVGGPPLVLYFLNEKTEKSLMRANMIWIFGLSSFLTAITYYLAGNMQEIREWSLLLPMLPSVFVGIWLGERMFYRLNQHLFRRLSLIVVFCGAFLMLLEGFGLL